MKEILQTVEPQVCAVAVINLDNLAENYREIKSQLRENTISGAVVKANAYGFGAIPVSKKLYKEGCRHFFVATIEEGIELREVIGKDANIYSLIGIIKGCENLHYKYNIIPVLNDLYQVDIWLNYSRKVGEKLNAVLQVDTGMCRNGMKERDIQNFHKKIIENFNILFVLSHLACADTIHHELNTLQLNRFKKLLDIFGKDIKASFSATNGIFLGPEYHFNIVRPGKGLYGFSIREDKIGSLKPVMNIFARIIQINDISVGETIGYGATFTANRNMKTITVGIGYADGFMRKFSAFGHGFLGGKKIPIVGRISMDYIVLDVTDVDESYINIGDWISFTRDPDYTLEKWALEMETLPHEVACRFGKRVKRLYIENEN